ncbi:MAG: S53 family peptidase [Intrasporangium sp.]|uniref:S53 family peptidase n=1 Tax=Intrasporangium sp. TaxID=1925024 RepID=UPI002648BC48|nr:S53 family peptidase [Intrasporangium sp.]MDN5797921.1 S53 family peptidase [Intrasporangium sp.]
MARHPLVRSVAAATAALTGVTIAGLVTTGTAQAAGHSQHRHQVTSASRWTRHVHGSTLAASHRVQVKVWLATRDADGLTALATTVSDPHSATYAHYLTSAEYDSRFAPTRAEVASVTAWLRAAGLRVEGSDAAHHYVAASGSAAAINTAFTAGIKQYHVAGQAVTGATEPITVPSPLATSVTAVTGIDTLGHQVTPNIDRGGPDPALRRPVRSSDLGPPAGFVNAPPCSAYYGQKQANNLPAFEGEHLPYAVCGYVPRQLRSVYGLTGTRLTGRGQTIAITDAFESPWLLKDANTYARRHGDQRFRRGQFTSRSDTDYDPAKVEACGGNDWYSEQSLDVEAEHAMAPDASVVYYGAASCYDDDLMAAMARAVSDNKASIVSNSWGEPTYVTLDDGTVVPVIDDALVTAYESILKQGAVQGIGFYFSSGDGGDEAAAYGVKQTDYPASDPWVTAVGGTALAIDRHGRRDFETGWGTKKWALSADESTWSDTGLLYGAGGGCSAWFTSKPFYQRLVRTGCSGRAVPDIAMNADPNTGMLIGQTQHFSLRTRFGKGTHYGEYRIGGTSLASPLLAGLNAAAQQGRSRIGFANTLIYLVGPATAYDVTPQGDRGNVRIDYVNGLNKADGTVASVRTFDEDSSLTTGRGWDEVTGVGAPTLEYDLAVHLLRLP